MKHYFEQKEVNEYGMRYKVKAKEIIYKNGEQQPEVKKIKGIGGNDGTR